MNRGKKYPGGLYRGCTLIDCRCLLTTPNGCAEDNLVKKCCIVNLCWCYAILRNTTSSRRHENHITALPLPYELNRDVISGTICFLELFYGLLLKHSDVLFFYSLFLVTINTNVIDFLFQYRLKEFFKLFMTYGHPAERERVLFANIATRYLQEVYSEPS